MTGTIFISYRRSETAWAARALFERLWQDFGEQVCIDLDGPPEDCVLVLAVIGPTWFDEIRPWRDDGGEPDRVRGELARALQRGLPVLPVQVDGAALPSRAELPQDLKNVSLRSGMALQAAHFDDQVTDLVQAMQDVLSGREKPVPGPGPVTGPAVVRSWPSWLHDEGVDLFGRWCEFQVGSVVQRMRWIEPGEFWMGSPLNKAERQSNELRHRVVLTRGFWLADTTCTQALWREVVGSNPSHFQGDLQLPVERVSWNDITGVFLPKLHARVPGLNLELPSEAQWEYACRAGTTTPFSFGAQVTSEQVNFDGNYPYNGGEKSQYREKTVPVKSLPANPWGLHEMHGNVWEWCADQFRAYPPGPVTDPVVRQDHQGTRLRVLRGGSWIDYGRYCRCANRDASVPNERYPYFGFRLARASADL
ncbi:SUMF1/EgtB/PvdO family nonheme iron enzyme [Sphaerotilus sp.]|uniref:SUMF1/EgtB/PvdO family nonheme iron enzyme n=1 Tax=Sphaerotilus sp. TaxID=2093942 RepID=UPI002ACD546D|nr:SUMF1/EgtB/PvdO family nonheme iron enzyme [Sphaerotilus sp.]MDZ7855226.1 SUMF1/EgtB/PvdO family nonheme iron enzyme [Sphaerotilus sp.]